MKIYAMSDIHGCLQAFNEALELVDLSAGINLSYVEIIYMGDKIIMVFFTESWSWNASLVLIRSLY